MTNLSIVTLKKHPELFRPALEMIEEGLAYPKDHHFLTDFFPLVNPKNHANNFLIINRQIPVAHLGVQLRELEFNLPVALIGGVVVAKPFRGRGLFSLLMNHVLKKFISQVGLFLLWGDQEKLYRRFGFFPAGCFSDYHPKNTRALRIEKTDFSKLAKKEWEDIKFLYEKEIRPKYLCLARKKEDWENIKKITSAQIYLKKDKQGKVLSYIIQGKGADLQGVIHEMGPLAPLKDDLQGVRIWHPCLKGEDLKVLVRMRMGNWRLFKRFLANYSKSKLELISWGEQVVVGLGGGLVSIPEESFFPHIFGPNVALEVEEFSRPLFFSGLDSV